MEQRSVATLWPPREKEEGLGVGMGGGLKVQGTEVEASGRIPGL